jgi:hypothetical protein
MSKKSISQIMFRASRGVPDSRSQKGWCKNEGCPNVHRDGSTYCQSCSERHKRKVALQLPTKTELV